MLAVVELLAINEIATVFDNDEIVGGRLLAGAILNDSILQTIRKSFDSACLCVFGEECFAIRFVLFGLFERTIRFRLLEERLDFGFLDFGWIAFKHILHALDDDLAVDVGGDAFELSGHAHSERVGDFLFVRAAFFVHSICSRLVKDLGHFCLS